MIEEAAEVTKAAGLDVYSQVEGIQPICLKMQNGLTPVGAAVQSKKAAQELLTLLLQSVKDFRHYIIPQIYYKNREK